MESPEIRLAEKESAPKNPCQQYLNRLSSSSLRVKSLNIGRRPIPGLTYSCRNLVGRRSWATANNTLNTIINTSLAADILPSSMTGMSITFTMATYTMCMVTMSTNIDWT